MYSKDLRRTYGTHRHDVLHSARKVCDLMSHKFSLVIYGRSSIIHRTRIDALMLVDVTALVRSTQQSWALILIIMFADFVYWFNDSSRTVRWYGKARYALMGFEQNSRSMSNIGQIIVKPRLCISKEWSILTRIMSLMLDMTDSYRHLNQHDSLIHWLSPSHPHWGQKTLPLVYSSRSRFPE